MQHLYVLFLGGNDALPHEEPVVLKELVVLLRVLLALVQQEADHSLLQDISKLSERGDAHQHIWSPGFPNTPLVTASNFSRWKFPKVLSSF